MLNLALRKQIHSTHTQGNKSHTCTYMELQNISLGFHVPNTKERFSSYNYVEHLKWRYSNLYKPRSRTYIGKNVKLAWNLKEKITESWSQICVLEALFLGEERRRSLARHGDVEMEVICVENHGGWRFGREFGEGDGKKRENGEKEDEDGVEVKECDKWMGFWVK